MLQKSRIANIIAEMLEMLVLASSFGCWIHFLEPA